MHPVNSTADLKQPRQVPTREGATGKNDWKGVRVGGEASPRSKWVKYRRRRGGEKKRGDPPCGRSIC